MKKLFLLCAVALMINLTADAQIKHQSLPNSEIAKIINKSKQANEHNGIFDPNKIYPGQDLTFLFNDGFSTTLTVLHGDSQWGILKTRINELTKIHGSVVDYGSQPVKPTATYHYPTPLRYDNPFWYYQLPPWVITLFILLVILTFFGVIWMMLFRRRSPNAYLNDHRAYAHQIALVNQMSQAGISNAGLTIGDMSMYVNASKQSNQPSVTNITNIYKTIVRRTPEQVISKTKDDAKKEVAPVAETKAADATTDEKDQKAG